MNKNGKWNLNIFCCCCCCFLDYHIHYKDRTWFSMHYHLLGLREVSKPEKKGECFPNLPRGPADVNVSEKHVWSLVLHKNIFLLENFGENASKCLFVYSTLALKGTLPANVLKTPHPGQRLTSCWRHEMLLCTLLMMTSVLCRPRNTNM